jgi:hypothetical protein
MEDVTYESLSPPEQKSAQRRAKRLLRTASTIVQPPERPPVEGLATAYLKPENVMAVLIHQDPVDESWHSDIVLRRGNRLVHERAGDGMYSKRAAMSAARRRIGEIKGTEEHRMLPFIRSQGFDPNQVDVLQIDHDEFGCRWFFLSEPAVAKGAEYFTLFVECCYGDAVDKIEFARTLLLLDGPNFKANPAFLLADDDMIDDAPHLQWNAAAFLLSNKITSIGNYVPSRQDSAESAFWQQVAKLNPALTLH